MIPGGSIFCLYSKFFILPRFAVCFVIIVLMMLYIAPKAC